MASETMITLSIYQWPAKRWLRYLFSNGQRSDDYAIYFNSRSCKLANLTTPENTLYFWKRWVPVLQHVSILKIFKFSVKRTKVQ